MYKRIPFNMAPLVGGELDFIAEALRSDKISGDGEFGKKCQSVLEKLLDVNKVLLTPSCTAALEMAALLTGVGLDDEVIMPSYTFVSTANAFALRGAKIVFVDIRPDTLNIDENKIEMAITERTRVIVPVHYAGVSCDMDKIMALAERYDLLVIEDAAQAIMSCYKGEMVGRKGHFAALSFHETKNLTSGGEGGALIINDQSFIGDAEIIREKGTNRSNFFRGEVDKYTWLAVGSSFLPGELQAAHLFCQLLQVQKITARRLSIWQRYYDGLKMLAAKHKVVLPIVPEDCQHNGHIFYLRCETKERRNALLAALGDGEIGAVFHYLPLHSSPAGEQIGRFHGTDVYTTKASEQLLRLPVFYNMQDSEVDRVISGVLAFFDAG